MGAYRRDLGLAPLRCAVVVSDQFWLCMANLFRWSCVLVSKERNDVCHDILRVAGDQLVFMRAQSVAVVALNALEVEGRVKGPPLVV